MSDSVTHGLQHQTSLSFTISPSLLKLISIESVIPANHLILCCSLFSLPSVFPSIRVFSNELVHPISWPKYWSFSFSISPSNEYSGLISFRTDISLLSKGLSRVFSNTIQRHNRGMFKFLRSIGVCLNFQAIVSWVPVPSHPLQLLIWLVFLILAILISVWWYHFNLHFLVTNNVDSLFMCLFSIHPSSLTTYLSKSFAHFWWFES